VTHLLDVPLVQLAVALGLGLLVGLQREWVEGKPIGLRSFALITLMGAISGLFAAKGFWMVAAGLLAVTIAVLVHAVLLAREHPVKGMTTELAAITMFLIGAMTTSGWIVPAVVLGGAVTLLLHWKQPLHAWIEQIEGHEFRAVVRFVLLTLVVLPVLPDRTFGPYDVLNPFQIWLMVVLIVALNLTGYFGMQLTAGRGGALLGGVLGGLVSSTATTVSFASRSRKQARSAPVAAVVILLASTIVYVRIVVETVAVSPGLLAPLALPLIAYTVLLLATVGLFLRGFDGGDREDLKTGNPAELSTALFFGAVYSVVIFVSAAVSHYFGETMLYPVAIVSGLTDVDAITLSTARLHEGMRISADTAWRVVFLASVSNLAFKTGVVGVLGGPALRRRLVPVMIILVIAGVAVTVFWP
jgi:uncharacterized membrane protein (DUF4010 family)